MPSTEFLLYLVIVIFAVFVIMNYYRDNTPVEPEIQYKYIPVYKSSSDDKSDDNRSNRSQGSQSPSQYDRYDRSRQGGQSGPEGEQDINIDIHNRNGGRGFPPIPPIDPLRKFDYDAVEDDFTPPFRRSYYDEYNYRLLPGLYPTYTRGPPGRFRKVGTLIAQGVGANDKYKFLIMMGRQKYHCRDFEYFATSSNTEQRLKFYIETKGKEISDGDIVTIKELDGYTFRFSEDPDLSPRYDPYLI